MCWHQTDQCFHVIDKTEGFFGHMLLLVGSVCLLKYSHVIDAESPELDFLPVYFLFFLF